MKKNILLGFAFLLVFSRPVLAQENGQTNIFSHAGTIVVLGIAFIVFIFYVRRRRKKMRKLLLNKDKSEDFFETRIKRLRKKLRKSSK